MIAGSRNSNHCEELVMTGTARLRSPPEIACDVRTLELMLSAARLQARRLGRTLRLSAEEQDDAEQDILLVLLERHHYFDEARGHLTAFIYRIARQATQAIADRITANWATVTVSLELSATREAGDDEAPASLADRLADPRAPDEATILDALSFRGFVAGLPGDLALIVQSIFACDGDIAEAQRQSDLSVSEFYRRLRELRYRMVSARVAPKTWFLKS
jgi:hypothetical protein